VFGPTRFSFLDTLKQVGCQPAPGLSLFLHVCCLAGAPAPAVAAAHRV